MRRILLTSGEVSILASMTIVVVCTLALFLSGYAIQQRTLRDLRVAIRPREARAQHPLVYLPEYFQAQQPDASVGGTITTERNGVRDAHEAVSPQSYPLKDTSPDAAGAAADKSYLSLTDASEGTWGPSAGTSDTRTSRAAGAAGTVSAEQRAVVEQLQAQVAAKSWGVAHPDPAKRSRIPVTRVERRRIIKEEIRRLSEAQQPVYYQRRLW